MSSNDSARARTLADRFEAVNHAWLNLVEPLSEAQWRRLVENEGRSVAVMTYHAASSHAVVMGWVQAVNNGQALPPVTSDILDQYNARQAADQATCDKHETIALLRQNTASVAAVIRALSEAHLDQTSPLALMGGQAVSMEGLIAFGLIAHAENHLASVRAALED